MRCSLSLTLGKCSFFGMAYLLSCGKLFGVSSCNLGLDGPETVARAQKSNVNPVLFHPERWLGGLEKRLPRGGFIPFGMGSRKCVGASFAMMEATLLLATVARRWRFELGATEVGTHPSITLRPAAAMPARVRRVA